VLGGDDEAVVQVSLRLPEETVGAGLDALERDRRTARPSLLRSVTSRGLDELSNALGRPVEEALSVLVSMLLYLCTDDPDLRPHVVAGPGAKRAGPGQARAVEAGWRLGRPPFAQRGPATRACQVGRRAARSPPTSAVPIGTITGQARCLRRKAVASSSATSSQSRSARHCRVRPSSGRQLLARRATPSRGPVKRPKTTGLLGRVEGISGPMRPSRATSLGRPGPSERAPWRPLARLGAPC
jgi:hypothetical protein